MLIQGEGQLELGANAIGAGHEDRFAITRGNAAKGPEPANAPKHFWAHGALGKGLNSINQRIASVNVDTGISVRQACR